MVGPTLLLWRANLMSTGQAIKRRIDAWSMVREIESDSVQVNPWLCKQGAQGQPIIAPRDGTVNETEETPSEC